MIFPRQNIIWKMLRRRGNVSDVAEFRLGHTSHATDSAKVKQ